MFIAAPGQDDGWTGAECRLETAGDLAARQAEAEAATRHRPWQGRAPTDLTQEFLQGGIAGTVARAGLSIQPGDQRLGQGGEFRLAVPTTRLPRRHAVLGQMHQAQGVVQHDHGRRPVGRRTLAAGPIAEAAMDGEIRHRCPLIVVGFDPATRGQHEAGAGGDFKAPPTGAQFATALKSAPAIPVVPLPTPPAPTSWGLEQHWGVDRFEGGI